MKNIKNTITLKNYYLVIFILSFSYFGFAQNNNFLSSQTSDQIIVTDRNNFKIVSNGRISNRGQIDLNNSEIVWSAQFGEYDIYIDKNPQRESHGEGYPTSKYYLLYDDAKQKIAIFTGNIVCQLNDNVDAIDIANDYNLILSYDFSSINQAFYNFQNIDGLQVMLEQLRSDYRIKKAYPEILENFRRAQ